MQTPDEYPTLHGLTDLGLYPEEHATSFSNAKCDIVFLLAQGLVLLERAQDRWHHSADSLAHSLQSSTHKGLGAML